MIDGNQLREEFGRYLAEHKATRWGMDAALMHVCKIAYDAGKADGPGAYRNGAAATLDGLLTDRMKRSVKVEQVLQGVADGKRPVLTPDECRALSLSLGTPDEDFSCAKAVLDTLYRQEFEIEVPAEPGLHPLKFTGLPVQNWRDEQLHAHIQRGAGVEVGESVTCEQCGHENWIMYGKAPAQITAADMLAPSPDQFRDAAGMVGKPADPDPLHLSRILHELAGAASLCWEPRPTGVFDSQLAIQFVEQALAEIRSRMTPAPAEVPMPEPDGELEPNGEGFSMLKDPLFDDGGDIYAPHTLRAYGDAREAAGYARGLADERERICAAIKAEDDYCVTEGDYMLDSDDCIRVARGTWERPDYALRGEVKP